MEKIKVDIDRMNEIEFQICEVLAKHVVLSGDKGSNFKGTIDRNDEGELLMYEVDVRLSIVKEEDI